MTSTSTNKSFSGGDEEKEKRTETLCQSLLQNIENGDKIDLQEGMKGILYMLFSIKTSYVEKLEHKIDELEDKNIDLQNRVADLEKKLIGFEMTQNQTKVILRNVPLHDGVMAKQNETHDQTIEICEDLLKDLNLDEKQIADCRRFGKPKFSLAGKKEYFPPIEMTFDTVKNKHAFFKNLVNLKNSDKFKAANVSDYIPPSLVPDYNKASSHAYQLRENKKNKTRIKIINYEITILAFPKIGRGFSKEAKIIPKSAWKESKKA